MKFQCTFEPINVDWFKYCIYHSISFTIDADDEENASTIATKYVFAKYPDHAQMLKLVSIIDVAKFCEGFDKERVAVLKMIEAKRSIIMCG